VWKPERMRSTARFQSTLDENINMDPKDIRLGHTACMYQILNSKKWRRLVNRRMNNRHP
jgi:hypothetical protein